MNFTPLINFKDIHSGKQAFVCGSGPSLKDVPKNIIDKGVTICVNASGTHFEKFDYLYLTDAATPHMAYWDEVCEKAESLIFANPELAGECAGAAQKTNKPCYLMTRNYDESTNYKFNSHKLCMGQDAPISATHLAYVMGCRPIILCGIDLCFNAGQRYFDDKAYDHAPDSPYAEAWARDYKKGKLDKGGYETDIWLNIALPTWNMVYKQNPNIKEVIFNASAISKVPHFDKINLNE